MVTMRARPIFTCVPVQSGLNKPKFLQMMARRMIISVRPSAYPETMRLWGRHQMMTMALIPVLRIFFIAPVLYGPSRPNWFRMMADQATILAAKWPSQAIMRSLRLFLMMTRGAIQARFTSFNVSEQPGANMPKSTPVTARRKPTSAVPLP